MDEGIEEYNSDKFKKCEHAIDLIKDQFKEGQAGAAEHINLDICDIIIY